MNVSDIKKALSANLHWMGDQKCEIRLILTLPDSVEYPREKPAVELLVRQLQSLQLDKVVLEALAAQLVEYVNTVTFVPKTGKLKAEEMFGPTQPSLESAALSDFDIDPV